MYFIMYDVEVGQCDQSVRNTTQISYYRFYKTPKK